MSDPATAQPLPEVKATAHLMLFEPGAYCVFNTPGSAPPDPVTGLPGVRVCPAPGPGPYGGVVTVAGFNGEGWLAAGDDAALVRVSGGPALVLFTIYQESGAGAAHEPPKLQIMRLSEAARPAAVQAIEVVAHQYGRGDVAGRMGEWVGERGSRRWLEGFALQPMRHVPAAEIEYQAVLGRDWLSPWSEGGQFCGSRGMSLPILGLRVRLRGASAATHQVAVSATFVDGSSAGPVLDGGACEAESLAALEAFRVELVARAPEPPRPPLGPAPGPALGPPGRAKRGKR